MAKAQVGVKSLLHWSSQQESASLEVRMAAVLREQFEVAAWRRREARFAAFVQEILGGQQEQAMAEAESDVERG